MSKDLASDIVLLSMAAGGTIGNMLFPSLWAQSIVLGASLIFAIKSLIWLRQFDRR